MKSRVAPSAKAITQLQRIASGLSDQQATFMKSLEYYMHRIGVRFEESPQFRDRIQRPTGVPPPVPLPPGRWPTRTPDDQQTILKLQNELMDLEQQLNFKVCAVANLEESTSEMEREAQVAANRIDALHTDILSLRKENADLKKINAECSATGDLSDTDPSLYTTIQANIQACRACHLAVLAQKEAAQTIALARHEYILAKEGLQTEIIRLKDENRGLQATLKVNNSGEAGAAPAYSDRIRCLNKEVADYKAQLKAVISTNQELADKLNALLPEHASPHMLDASSLQAKVEELSALLEAVRIQNQEEIGLLQTDHAAKVTSLQQQLSQLELRHNSTASSHAAEILQRDGELDRIQRSHAQTVESLQTELTNLRQQAFTTRESMASISSSMVASLREEIDEQFHTIERLHGDLANSKRSSSSLQMELDRTKQELDHSRQDRASLLQTRETHQAEISSLHSDSLTAQEALTRANNMVNNLRDEVTHHESLMSTSCQDLQTALDQNRDHRRTIVEIRTAYQEAVDRQCSHNPNDCARSCPYVQPPSLTTRMELPGPEASGSVLPPEDNALVRSSSGVPGVTPISEASSMGPIRRSPSPIPEGVDDALEWPPLGASSESWADSCDREEASPPEPIPPTPLLPLTTVALVPNTVNRSVESAFPTSLVTATSIISSSTISTSSRAVPSNTAPPTPQEASTHLGPVSITPPTEPANASIAPPLASPQEGPFNPRNDYNWVPTAPASRLRPKNHDKPWTLFIGDSLLHLVNTSGVISGGQNNKQFQPHMQAVAWDLQDLALRMPGYTQNPADGIGLDSIIISVGTNDVARLQKFGGIASHVDRDHLVKLRVEQWEVQFKDMMEAAMACLDQFRTIYLILPIGISSISSEDTGIAFFRDLITRLAKNYPKLMLVDNANMIRRNRAVPSMIKEADDPHFSERGKKQMVENLLAALRIAQADIASYAFVVNDHFIKVKCDPHRPSPKASFNRRAASHTGVPEASSKRSESKPATTASHTSYAAAVTAQDLPVQPSRVRASSLLQLTRQALAAMATSSLVNPTVTTSPTVLATGPAAPMLSMGSVPPVSVPQTSAPQTSAPQASVNSIWQLPPPGPECCPCPIRGSDFPSNGALDDQSQLETI